MSIQAAHLIGVLEDEVKTAFTTRICNRCALILVKNLDNYQEFNSQIARIQRLHPEYDEV